MLVGNEVVGAEYGLEQVAGGVSASTANGLGVSQVNRDLQVQVKETCTLSSGGRPVIHPCGTSAAAASSAFGHNENGFLSSWAAGHTASPPFNRFTKR